jgi:hypothetical protein
VAAAVAADQGNVLSAIVTVQARHADSVAVRFGPADRPLDEITPAVPAAGSVQIPVLGLRPETRYRFEIAAFGGGATSAYPHLALETGPLPSDLPQYRASGANPTPGYVIFATGLFGLAVDNTGRVVWYHRFPDGVGLNFMAQPTGRYVARPVTPDPSDVEPWIEIDVLGRVTRTLGCARGLVARPHDFIADADGSYWLMCDDVRTMDLSRLGGSAAARVTGTVVQRIGPTGTLLAEWSPFDHFDLADVDRASLAEPAVNWTHGNAIDRDSDGNLVISFRNLNEVSKIDAGTGAVLWRMGGRRNQFSFDDGGTAPFLRQHGLRLTGPTELIVLDNLGDSTGSRAERYAFDPVRRTARLVRSYSPAERVTAQLGGTTQPLPNGHILVSFGTAGRVEEYDADGVVAWRLDGNLGYVFRAQRIRSLYQPGAGLSALEARVGPRLDALATEIARGKRARRR